MFLLSIFLYTLIVKFSVTKYASDAASHDFVRQAPQSIHDLICERLLAREEASGSRNILEQSLMARGLRISDFLHYTQVENMHSIIGLLKKDCGISFLYKVAVEKELGAGIFCIQ